MKSIYIYVSISLSTYIQVNDVRRKHKNLDLVFIPLGMTEWKPYQHCDIILQTNCVSCKLGTNLVKVKPFLDPCIVLFRFKHLDKPNQ